MALRDSEPDILLRSKDLNYVAGQIALLTASGLSGKFVDFVQKVLTPEQIANLKPDQWQELVSMGSAFNAVIKQQEGEYNWAIQQAKQALLTCTFLKDEEKIKAITDIDASTQKPGILYAFFSTFNIMTLVSFVVIIISMILTGT